MLCPDCAFCGSKLAVAGPLWLGTLYDQKFCQQVLEIIENGVFGTKKRAAKIITLCLNELDTVTFFDYHKLLRELKCPPVPIETLVSGLRTVGCRASRTHFSGTSIKTDADAATLKGVLFDLSCENEKARLNHC
jgi:tRNA (guanine26-N2/guanine27-N2)-dimethyltransferase